MQGIGNSSNLFVDFNGISNAKNGINDLAEICSSNPFQAILQAADAKTSIKQVAENEDETGISLSQEQLEALKGIIESLEDLDIKDESQEGDESGFMVLSETLEQLDIPSLLTELQSLKEILLNFLDENNSGDSNAGEDLLIEIKKTSDKLQSYLYNLQGGKQLGEEMTNQSMKQGVQLDSGTKIDSSVIEKLNAKRNELVGEIGSLMTKVIEGAEPAKIAPKVLKLLEQWETLGKQLEKVNNNSTSQSSQSTKQMNPEADSIWKTLAETFKKRTAIVDKRAYNTVSKVSAGDVAKWIANAVETNGQHSTVAMSSIPMHKLEQLAIHLNPLQSNQQQSEQFTSQFARIIDTSRFLQNGINGKPLTISLNPGNLGEIIVKMQRVNGELMVKLFVQSPEAKQLLESNLGQLRHMFSPHQVAVERQDTQQATTAQNTQQNEQGFRQDAKEQEQRNKQQQTNNPHNDELEEISFSEFLMNAKV